MSKFNSPKNKKNVNQFEQKGEPHVQCMNKHYAEFEYKGMKIIGVTDNTHQKPSKHF